MVFGLGVGVVTLGDGKSTSLNANCEPALPVVFVLVCELVGLVTCGRGVSLNANCEPALPLVFVLVCELVGLVTAGVVGVVNALPVIGLIRGVVLLLDTVAGGTSLPANADPDPAESLGVTVLF